jgi:predicted transcriptional regulator
MGQTKAFAFSCEENELASITKALGHPARIAILQLLLKKNDCICGDIVDELPLSQSTISQHLKELKAAGLIQGTIEGVRVCYCIDQTNWLRARQVISDFFNQKIEISDCC